MAGRNIKAPPECVDPLLEIDTDAFGIPKDVLALVPTKFSNKDVIEPDIELSDPRDAIFVIGYLNDPKRNVKKAAELVGYPLPIAQKLLESNRVKSFIRQYFRKRLARMTIDGDQLVLEVIDNARRAKRKGKFDSATAAYSAAAKLMGISEGASEGGAHQNVNIYVGPTPNERQVLEGHAELHSQAASLPRPADVSGPVLPGILRAERLPVHQNP